MNLFGCKFCDQNNSGDETCDRKNFDSLLWALVTVFQVLVYKCVLSIGNSAVQSSLKHLYSIETYTSVSLVCHCWQYIFIFYKILLWFYPHNCFSSSVVDQYEHFILKSHFSFKFIYLFVQLSKFLYSFILFFILIQTAEFSKVSLNLTNVIADSQNAINLG